MYGSAADVQREPTRLAAQQGHGRPPDGHPASTACMGLGPYVCMGLGPYSMPKTLGDWVGGSDRPFRPLPSLTASEVRGSDGEFGDDIHWPAAEERTPSNACATRSAREIHLRVYNTHHTPSATNLARFFTRQRISRF